MKLLNSFIILVNKMYNVSCHNVYYASFTLLLFSSILLKVFICGYSYRIYYVIFNLCLAFSTFLSMALDPGLNKTFPSERKKAIKYVWRNPALLWIRPHRPKMCWCLERFISITVWYPSSHSMEVIVTQYDDVTSNCHTLEYFIVQIFHCTL